jgi:hypothetical protein
MAQLGNVPAIVAVKEHFERLKEKGLIIQWEIPYENLLSRLTAAIFFFTPAMESQLGDIKEELRMYNGIALEQNNDRKLSRLEWKALFK